jgi:hypothetical protein
MDDDTSHTLSPVGVTSNCPFAAWSKIVLLLLLIIACAWLGILLYQSREREKCLRFSLLTVTVERDKATQLKRSLESELSESRAQFAHSEESLAAIRSALVSAEVSLSKIRVTLKDVEVMRDSKAVEVESLAARVEDVIKRYAESERGRMLAEANAERTRGELSDVKERASQQLVLFQIQAEKYAKVALDLRSKVNDVTSTINHGSLILTSIPRDQFFFSSINNDLASEYEMMIKKYNHLVKRFNAALKRCSELEDTVNSVILVLQR